MGITNDYFSMKFLGMAIGNVLEYYDFAIFGAFADVFAEQFFPPDKSEAAFLSSLAVFGVAFLMRPFGGVIMGYIGDTISRKRALEISIALMLFPSFIIGCLPTYATAGWCSTFLLIIMRMFQGMYFSPYCC